MNIALFCLSLDSLFLSFLYFLFHFDINPDVSTYYFAYSHSCFILIFIVCHHFQASLSFHSFLCSVIFISFIYSFVTFMYSFVTFYLFFLFCFLSLSYWFWTCHQGYTRYRKRWSFQAQTAVTQPNTSVHSQSAMKDELLHYL